MMRKPRKKRKRKRKKTKRNNSKLVNKLTIIPKKNNSKTIKIKRKIIRMIRMNHKVRDKNFNKFDQIYIFQVMAINITIKNNFYISMSIF